MSFQHSEEINNYLTIYHNWLKESLNNPNFSPIQHYQSVKENYLETFWRIYELIVGSFKQSISNELKMQILIYLSRFEDLGIYPDRFYLLKFGQIKSMVDMYYPQRLIAASDHFTNILEMDTPTEIKDLEYVFAYMDAVAYAHTNINSYKWRGYQGQMLVGSRKEKRRGYIFGYKYEVLAISENLEFVITKFS